ncbi:MAG: ribosome biogenesis GTPase YlqF, partial [Paraglaciecola polaris]
PELLKERFKLEYIPDTEIEFLEMAAAQRGALRAGGRVNLHKICEVLVNEFRSGKLGRISLETPEMVLKEEAEMAAAELKKAEEKAQRKERFKTGSLTRDKKAQKEHRIERVQRRSKEKQASKK